MGVLVTFMTVCGLLCGDKKDEALHARGKFTSGVVINDVHSGGRGSGTRYDYHYFVNGDQYTAHGSGHCSLEFAREMKDKHIDIPVLYDSLNPETSVLLISLFHMEAYLSPDSIQLLLQ